MVRLMPPESSAARLGGSWPRYSGEPVDVTLVHPGFGSTISSDRPAGVRGWPTAPT